MPLELQARHESWPIAGSFRISRGAKTSAEVVVAEVTDGTHTGRGECVPYARYDETVEGVLAAIRAQADTVAGEVSPEALCSVMPAGAARNAIDCALWDFEAKRSGTPAWRRAGLDALAPLTTAYTLSLDTPEKMAMAARDASHRPLLKIKLGQTGDDDRLRAIRASAPDARLIVDANEGWDAGVIAHMFEVCAETRVELVEQPLPAGDDDLLATLERRVPVCADESAHGLSSLERLVGRYDAINIKLDKTGGLTEALQLAKAAAAADLDIMVGCMLATSLAMAPAMVVAQYASVVDLDGPLLLAEDRSPGITYDGSTMQPPEPDLWG